jgi:hypothetical protein
VFNVELEILAGKRCKKVVPSHTALEFGRQQDWVVLFIWDRGQLPAQNTCNRDVNHHSKTPATSGP